MAKAIEIPVESLMPAIEYCITDGPGLLIDFGVTTDEMRVSVFELANELKVWVAPTTTACETGK